MYITINPSMLYISVGATKNRSELLSPPHIIKAYMYTCIVRFLQGAAMHACNSFSDASRPSKHTEYHHAQISLPNNHKIGARTYTGHHSPTFAHK